MMLRRMLSAIVAAALIIMCSITAIGADNTLLNNPGFESTGRWSGLERSSEEVHSGTYSAKLTKTADNNAYVYQKVTDIHVGATYRLSAWVKRTTSAGNFRFHLKYFDSAAVQDTETQLKQEDLNAVETQGEWTYVCADFTVPEATASLRVYCRLYADTTATAYVDDVSLEMIDAPKEFFLTTDQVYYYRDSDVTKGTIRLTANSSVFPEYTAWKADVKILDGETELFSKAGLTFTEKEIEVDFPLSLLSDPQKDYTVTACVKASDEAVLLENEKTICRRFYRPTMIDAEGRFNVNGEDFMPVIGYHIYNSSDYYAQAKSLGINVFQACYNMTKEPDKVIAELDKLKENGVMGLVCLYVGSESGWSDSLREYTKALIPLIKNHPALFGYCLLDEPSPIKLGVEELSAAYEFIRSEDAVHPLYACNQKKYHAEWLSAYNDIVGFDCYPYGVQTEETYIAEVMESACFYTQNTKKPVIAIVQFFQRSESRPYFPTPDEMRNMIYQNYLAGASGIGFYAIASEKVTDYATGESVRNLDTPTAEAIRAWNSNEKAIIADHFSYGNGTVLDEGKTDKLWWQLWQSEGSSYLLALNRTNAALETSITNDNFHEYILIDAIGGGNETIIVNKADGELRLSLPASGAVLYRVELGEVELASGSDRYGSWRLYYEDGKIYVEAKNFYTWKNYNVRIESDVIKETMTCEPVDSSQNGKINELGDGYLGVKAYCKKTVTYQLHEN